MTIQKTTIQSNEHSNGVFVSAIFYHFVNQSSRGRYLSHVNHRTRTNERNEWSIILLQKRFYHDDRGGLFQSSYLFQQSQI